MILANRDGARLCIAAKQFNPERRISEITKCNCIGASMPASALMNVMVNAARKAGRSLARDFGEVDRLQVSVKGPANFVSAADHRAEDIIFYELSKARPDYAFLMEERGTVDGADKTHRWIVDPLDGTTNFLHGLPHWAVSIALEHKGQIVAGVVYDPVKDEMFFAERGQGAFMNDQRLRVSQRRNMIECVFATGIPFAGRGDLPETLQDLARLMPACAGVRRWGAAALDLTYVAAGRYDGFWERGLNIWDIAAGVIIAREAGALIEGIAPEDDPLTSGALICAPENMFAPFSKVVRGA